MRIQQYGMIRYEKREITRGSSVSLSQFADLCECQEELVRHMVRFGIIDSLAGLEEPIYFSPSEIIRARKALRLKKELDLNLNALGLVLDLLDRIAELERGLRELSR